MPEPSSSPGGSTAPPLTVGIDIGGTKVLGGVVDAMGRVLASDRRETPSWDPEAVEDTIVGLVSAVAHGHDVAAVGVGAAGLVDADRSSVLFAPHLRWRHGSVGEALASRLGLPVIVDNDANAAALAESRFGAGAGHRIVLCVTVGTGIGGALVVDQEVYRGAHGMAGEYGHMQVVPGGHPCSCGNSGCWEEYASGSALVRAARQLVLGGAPSADPLRVAAGGDVSRLDGPVVTEAAREGDPLAVELLAEAGRWLGTGLANVVAALDPGLVVVGGGVSEAGDLLLDPARAAFSRQLFGRGHRSEPSIVAAALGQRAGLVGAAEIARSFAR